MRAVDAVVRPEPRDDRNLIVVFGLDDDHESGSAGLLVEYHDATASYVWHDHLTYEVRVGSSCPR